MEQWLHVNHSCDIKHDSSRQSNMEFNPDETSLSMLLSFMRLSAKLYGKMENNWYELVRDLLIKRKHFEEW